MDKLLYLDTARLGKMVPGAQRAQCDYAQFAGEVGCSLYFEEFLREGSAACPPGFTDTFPGLAAWQGISEFKSSVRKLLGSSEELPVLLADSSMPLMQLSARLLFQPCRNVLVSDLGWPPYYGVLATEAKRCNRKITTVKVRSSLQSLQLSETDVIARFVSTFVNDECDGLFLTAVSHDGIRLPIERIVQEIERHRQVRFVVIDGAQALNHTPEKIDGHFCDLFLASAHKWLGAYQPLGMAFYGRCRSRSYIDTHLDRALANRIIEDPLLRFTRQLERGELSGHSETVNLGPLFSCCGAVLDALSNHNADAFSQRLRNSSALIENLNGLPWRALRPSEALRSGIILLQSRSPDVRLISPQDLRRAFQERQITVTAYDGGQIRLSMPGERLQPADSDLLRAALKQVA